MMYIYAALIGLFGCNLLVFAVAIRAAARVAAFEKSVNDMDWEAVARITGDIGSVKRSIQQVNNRINGFERPKADDAAAQVQAALAARQQPNVSFIGG
jgi:hypothetical protein